LAKNIISSAFFTK